MQKQVHYWKTEVYHGVPKLGKTVTELFLPKCMSVWHSLYTDNLYNSVALVEFLLVFYTVGTLRCCRGELLEIWETGKMQTGDVTVRSNGTLHVLSWVVAN